MTSKTKTLLPIIYGVMHAIVDASCVMTVFAAIGVHHLTPTAAFTLVVAYDVLAFGSQALWGALADRMSFVRGSMLLGLALTALGVGALPLHAITAMLLVAFGNALFHVGGGAFSLQIDPGRATPPGLFVAPGALGLALGVFLGKSGDVVLWPFLVALALSMAVALTMNHPSLPDPQERLRPRPPRASLILLLLLVSILLRSLVGLAGSASCPKETILAFGLALAAFGGKALGAILSDRLGWIRTTVAALILSAPLIALGQGQGGFIMAGMFLFQMTMPVTLVAVYQVLPGRPGLAFGLPCLALILGALPTFTVVAADYYTPEAFLAVILLAAAVVYGGLRMLEASRAEAALSAQKGHG